jgi:transcriptional regulator with XRE-family HTH domain
VKAPTYADEVQIRHFLEWFEDERKRTNTSKTQLAEALGRDGTAYVTKILQGRTLPTPSTLRRLCAVMSIPWFVAFARIGYYRSILLVLQGMVALGQKWCIEDATYPTPSASTFRYAGVLRIGSEMVVDALSNPQYGKRYVVGAYREVPEDVGIVSCVVPKPLAVAIFVACAGFPRRGDVYKDGLSRFAADLLTSASDLVNLADSGDDSQKPSGLLGDADNALKNQSMPFDADE